MKKILGVLVLIVSFQSVLANHLKGGWIQYEYVGVGTLPNTLKYTITVRQYLDCGSTGGQIDANIFLGIFDGGTNATIQTLTIPLTGTVVPNKTTYSPCLSATPPVCYRIDSYTATVDLPINAAGYTLAVQRCCRILGIVNLGAPSNSIGISYTTKIPGTINGVDYANNKSPVFAQKDTVIVCFNSPFTFDFSATDADGDQLTYNFCNGLAGGNNSAAGAQPNPPSNPPYADVTYNAPFTGSSPLGSLVNIDPVSGLISGTAPSITGDYVIAVCANEFRNGVLIGTTKKEIHIKVENCSLSAATLKPTYITCNGTTLSFQNESTSSSITSYLWDFGVPNLSTDTSTNPTPTYDFLLSGKDSGTYTVKLKVSSAGGCQDSATATVLVYPGFKTNFNIQGTCVLNAYTFTDATTSIYGVVDSWKWDLGDPTTLADTARSKDTAWKYATPQTVQVKLTSTNSKGCVDTATRTLNILDRPVLSLPFRDTLICSIDTLAVKVNFTSGSVLWKPALGPNQNRILNANSPTALVFPRDSTRYYVTVNDNGCSNTDSVMVNVLQFISVDAGLDTTICLTDSFRLRPISFATSYQWTASSGEIVSPVKNPLVKPQVNTQYNVIANLGKCQAKDSVKANVAPYPTASVGPDATICFGSRIQLNGVITGSGFTWTPSASLLNENTLNPIAGPTKTTMYILTANDTQGCGKLKSDTIVITVNPLINAFAGNDTFAVANQPLQLIASGGTRYTWTPSTGLSDPNIYNPVVTLDNTIDAITYTVRVADDAGCNADAKVTIQVYKTNAEIFVPSAFTPNGDGKNDVLRPHTVGITQLSYFSIYNRWGQLIFTTTQLGKAWDGNFNGVAQASGTYVYQAEGKDFRGVTVYRKGTVVLIR